MKLHRWEYLFGMDLCKCVEPDLSDVPSENRCRGCGISITLERLAQFLSGKNPGVILSTSLNHLADYEETVWR